MQKKILFGLLALSLALLMYSVAAADTTGYGKFFQNKDYGEWVWWIKRSLYALWSLDYAKEDMGFVIANFTGLILLSPNAYSKEIQDGLKMFLEIIQPLYILTITVTAFYLIFISGSPGGRSKAKKFMKDLIVGMILISMSPMLLQGLVSLSSSITEAILNQTDTTIVTQNLESTFGPPAERSVDELSVENIIATATDVTEGNAIIDKISAHTCTLCMMHWIVTFTEIELGYYTFLPFMLMIWGLGVYFFLRFALVSLFMIVFPLSVLLYSFETTKAVGRNMLEQTIMWIFIQIFSAVVVVAIALCIIQSQPGMLTVPGVPYGMALPITEGVLGVLFFNSLETADILAQFGGMSVGAVIATRLTNPLIEFIPFAGCFALIFAPFFLLRLFKGFLP